MNSDRWQQVDRLLDEALALPSGEREAFLERVSAADEELRQEVRSLLNAHDRAEKSFLNAPALEMAAKRLGEEQANILIGERFGFYRIRSLLGVGGMGEVYLARDERLGRLVALKLLPRQFVEDRARVERFAREARVVSGLNHPNIVTVYDIGEIEGVHYIAMEYVEGQTIRQTMANRRLKLDEALDVAIQAVNALVAAHGAGIAHRDIKPENIMVRPDGYVKLMDFGIAKTAKACR